MQTTNRDPLIKIKKEAAVAEEATEVVAEEATEAVAEEVTAAVASTARRDRNAHSLQSLTADLTACRQLG